MKEGKWSDEVGEILENRNIQIVSNNADVAIITINKSIIDWTKEYVIEKEKEELNKAINCLNYICIYKKMYLLCKMVGTKGNIETAAKMAC